MSADAPDRVLVDVAWLLDRAGTYLQTRGEPHAARPVFTRAHTLRRDLLGEDHPDTLTSANNLAVDLRALGEAAAARALDEDTLTRSAAGPRRGPPGHPDLGQQPRRRPARLWGRPRPPGPWTRTP